MTVSQLTIAEALNISVATVSRSLRNHPAISPETRARVGEAAVRFGYKVNPAGRGRLPGSRSAASTASSSDAAIKSVQGLVPLAAICRGSINPNSVHNLVALRLIQGMSRGARANRASLHVEFLSSAEFDLLASAGGHPQVVRDAFVSGALLVNQPTSAVVHSLANVMPCINFERYSDCTTTDCVTEDNLGSMSLLFDHLLELGHRKIGLIDSLYDQPSYTARFAGYVQNLMERGMVYDPVNATLPDAPADLNIRIPLLADHVARQIRKNGVTAWICMNDYIGYQIMTQLARHNLSAPRDLSICGFDNFEPPLGLPKLTTIDGPFEEMGLVAVTRLIQRIVQKDLPPVHMMLRTRLITGQSTGPYGGGQPA